MIIKVVYLRGGRPHGRPYTFTSPVDVKVGDIVQISLGAIGVVVQTDVKIEDEVLDKLKLKPIIGIQEV